MIYYFNLPMRHYLKSLIITAAAFYLVYTFIPAINLGNDPKNVLILIGGLWLITHIVNPIFSLVLLPINILTFGFVSFVLNIALLYAITYFQKDFYFLPYYFPGANIQGIILPSMSLNSIATLVLVAVFITILQKVLQFIFE